MTAPRRRWFRFSLRTMFVTVTVLGVWLGWELQIVHTRQRLWKSINEAGGYTLSDGTTEIPAVRTWLGDKARGIIAVPAERFSLAETHEIERTFSEATVIRDPGNSIRREGDEDEE